MICMLNTCFIGGHCIGNCTPTCEGGQSEVKRSMRNIEADQAVKIGIWDSVRTVKVSRQSMGGDSTVNGQGQIFGGVKGSSMKF